MATTPKRKIQVEKKKIFEEFDRLEASPDASIDGAVIVVSPLKQGRKSMYFEGQLSDGTHQVRFVGFNRKQHESLETAMKNQQTVRLTDSEIKKSKYAKKLEIIIKRSTNITQSPKQIELTVADLENEIQLKDIQSKNQYDQISVKVKVVEVNDPVTVNGGLTKQDLIIADNTDVAKFTIWEDMVNLLAIRQSYHLKNVVVRQYLDQKYISMSKSSTEILSLDDIGVIKEDHNTQAIFNSSDETRIDSSNIVGVLDLNTYKMCITCKVPVSESPSNSSLGCCPKCFATLLLQRCVDQVQATLIVQSSMTSPAVSLSIMGDLLLKIARAESPVEVTAEDILTSDSFIITYNSNNLVTGVTDIL